MDIKQVLAAFGIKSSLAIGIIVSVYLIGVTPVVDGKTIVQIGHDHAERHIVKNREAVQVVMDSVSARDDVKSAQFRVYIQQNAVYKIMDLRGIDEQRRRIMLKEAEDRLKKHEKKLEDAENYLRKVSLKWPQYQIAVNYEA